MLCTPEEKGQKTATTLGSTPCSARQGLNTIAESSTKPFCLPNDKPTFYQPENSRGELVKLKVTDSLSKLAGTTDIEADPSQRKTYITGSLRSIEI